MTQKCMRGVLYVQRMCRNQISKVSSRFRTKMTFWTQKSAQFPRKTKKHDFWKIQLWFERPEMADLWPGSPFNSKVFPKFFISRTDKNWRFYPEKATPQKKGDFFFWGGGVELFVIVFNSYVSTCPLKKSKVLFLSVLAVSVLKKVSDMLTLVFTC